MKTILATLLTILLLLPVSAIGEIQTITHAVKQPFGGSQSPDDARIAAVAKAKREALELAGNSTKRGADLSKKGGLCSSFFQPHRQSMLFDANIS